MDPRKKITKVLTETGKKKLAEYVSQKRTDYEQALLKLYATLPALAKGSTATADRWKSGNAPHAVGAMNTFTSAYRGCKSSSSVLRPHHGITGSGLGTDAKPDVPKALADLQSDNFFKDTFISGHVMNADFGGVGLNAGNQTILTSAANSAHKSGWESPVKKAQYFMTLVVKFLRAFKLDGAKTGIVDGIESKWRIELSGVVEDESWWDVLSAVDQGTLTPAQEKIAKSIATEVNFTAISQDTPTAAELEQLEFDKDGYEFAMVVQYLEAFKQLMAQVGNFKLRQTPNGFGKATVTSS
jgi:hypothetical protein